MAMHSWLISAFRRKVSEGNSNHNLSAGLSLTLPQRCWSVKAIQRVSTGIFLVSSCTKWLLEFHHISVLTDRSCLKTFKVVLSRFLILCLKMLGAWSYSYLIVTQQSVLVQVREIQKILKATFSLRMLIGRWLLTENYLCLNQELEKSSQTQPSLSKALS